MDITSIIAHSMPESLLLNIEGQDAILVITPAGTLAFKGSPGVIESTNDKIPTAHIPDHIVLSAVRQTFAEYLISSGEWLPVNPNAQDDSRPCNTYSNAFLWRQTLPRSFERNEEQSKILGIKLSCIHRVDNHFELSFSFQSYAHKLDTSAGQAVQVTCLPNLTYAHSTNGPYLFEPTPRFDTWNALQQYWQKRYHYRLSDTTKMCINVHFGGNVGAQFTYPLECVLPGAVKFGAMTSYVDRPICLPLIKTALKNLILASPNAWSLALIVARNTLPPPLATFTSRRIPAAQYNAIVTAVEKTHVSDDLEQIFADDEWCRDLNALVNNELGVDEKDERKVESNRERIDVEALEIIAQPPVAKSPRKLPTTSVCGLVNKAEVLSAPKKIQTKTRKAGEKKNKSLKADAANAPVGTASVVPAEAAVSCPQLTGDTVVQPVLAPKGKRKVPREEVPSNSTGSSPRKGKKRKI